MQIGLGEFLEKVAKLRKTEQKVAALKANDSFELRVVLRAIYDPNVKILLPEGTPPFKVTDLPDQEPVLLREIRNGKFFYFVEGYRDDLPQAKREQMFIALLENVAPKDTELLIAMKDKKAIKGITIQHVVEGLPGLIT